MAADTSSPEDGDVHSLQFAVASSSAARATPTRRRLDRRRERTTPASTAAGEREMLAPGWETLSAVGVRAAMSRAASGEASVLRRCRSRLPEILAPQSRRRCYRGEDPGFGTARNRGRSIGDAVPRSRVTGSDRHCRCRYDPCRQ